MPDIEDLIEAVGKLYEEEAERLEIARVIRSLQEASLNRGHQALEKTPKFAE